MENRVVQLSSSAAISATHARHRKDGQTDKDLNPQREGGLRVLLTTGTGYLVDEIIKLYVSQLPYGEKRKNKIFLFFSVEPQRITRTGGEPALVITEVMKQTAVHKATFS